LGCRLEQPHQPDPHDDRRDDFPARWSKKDSLKKYTHHGDDDHTHGQSQKIIDFQQPIHVEDGEGSQHIELTVGKIKNVHHTENHRKPQR